jgi:hypothetical protein
MICWIDDILAKEQPAEEDGGHRADRADQRDLAAPIIWIAFAVMKIGGWWRPRPSRRMHVDLPGLGHRASAGFWIANWISTQAAATRRRQGPQSAHRAHPADHLHLGPTR